MTSMVVSPARGALDRAVRASSTADWLVIAWIAGSLAWFVPLFRFDWWTPRFALLVAAMPIGAVCWYRLARRGDRAAIVAAAFVAWAVLGALLSANPRLALGGGVGRDYSVTTFAGALAMWAIGRRLPAGAAGLIGPTVLAAVALNVLLGTYQVLVGITSGLYASSPSRASGLLVNPVYFGALMAGAFGYAAFAAGATGRRWLLAGLGAAGYGTMLSGSRVALAAALVLISVALVRASRAHRLPVAAAATIGLAVGYAVLQIGDGRSSVSRLSVGTEGRVEMWRISLGAMLDRPVLGTGIGLFRDGVQGRFPVDFARDLTALGRQSWADPHNVGVLMIVSTGFVGLALLTGFAWLSLREARGPLLALFAGIGLSWLLQPTPMLTAPIAMLALGAAAPRGAREPSTGRAPSARVTLAIGLVLASYVCVADLAFDRALRSDDERAIEVTRSFFLGDPNVEAIVGSWYLGSGLDESIDRAIEHAGLAAELDHTRPIRWVELARLQLRNGDVVAARDNLERAVDLQPTELSAWLLLIDVATELGDDALADEASVRSCELLPSC